MTDDELGRALLGYFSDVERDDLEHTVGCEACDLFYDSEHGRYRCKNNPAEIRELQRHADERQVTADLNAYGPPRPPDYLDALQERFAAMVTRDRALWDQFGDAEAVKTGALIVVTREVLNDYSLAGRDPET